MAGLAIAGELATGFIDKLLIDPAFSYLKKQVHGKSGLSSKLENLRDRLLDVEPLLPIAEQKMANNKRLAELLRNLEDAVYDAEDLVDEFPHPDPDDDSQQVEKGDVKGKKLALPHCLTSCFVIGRRVITLDKSTTKITAITEKLDIIREKIESLLRLLNLDNGSYQRADDGPKAKWRIQTSFAVEEMVGRDEEKQYIKSMILDSSHDEGGSSNSTGNALSVLPIVGIGGVGKTTLARSVYNDEDVQEDFDLRIWVCVSEDFDVLRLTREITERVTGNTLTHNLNLDDLQTKLHNEVISKRFLIVLDDVWNRENENLQRKWDLLRAPLINLKSNTSVTAASRVVEVTGTSSTRKGSKIIVTTRDERVAEIMGTIEHIRLNKLPDDIFLRFFMTCAFKDANPDNYPTLKDMGQEIARKLGGLPLAAKTMGALLNSNPEEEHWSNILQSEVWELPLMEDGIIPALRVSYIHLPAHLKQCFQYCAIFPKDYVFERDYLVLHWLAHGYIHPQYGAKRLEVIGKEYLDSLARRSFFQGTGEDGKYLMHDLIHDLAQSVSSYQCFRIEEQKKKLPRNIPPTVRHLSICTDNEVDLSHLEGSCDLRKLRTLVFFRGYMPKLFDKLERVRVLDLSGYPSKAGGLIRDKKIPPRAIADLKHLRYLNLHAIASLELPKPFCNLHHLQVLYLTRQCQKLPKDFSNLINLRHLMGKLEFVSPVAGVHKLKHLQELRAFKVLNKSGHELSELKAMNQLRGSLKIQNLEKVAGKKEAEEANLLQKENLENLDLEWSISPGTGAGNEGPYSDESIIEGLQPSPSLKKLAIWYYNGPRSPIWMRMEMLPKLEELSLSSCNKWEVLPALGQLRSLKFLNLQGMLAIRSIRGPSFYGSDHYDGNFPSLETLKFWNMNEWEEWLGVQDCQILFPCLEDLDIIRCPKLMALPLLPPKLERLHLFDVGLLSLPSWIPSSGGDGGIMPESSSSGSSNRLQPQGHASLSSLKMISCPRITSLPEQVLGRMTALKDLRLERCMELRTLEGLQAMVSLQRLEILLCPKLEGSWMTADGPPSLVSLLIDELKLLTAGFLHRSLGCIQVFILTSCRDLTRFSAEDWESMKLLKSIRELSILGCIGIQALPEDLQSLSSLRKLSITDCPEISSLPSKGLPHALEEFNAARCHPDLSLRCREGGEHWPMINHIPILRLTD